MESEVNFQNKCVNICSVLLLISRFAFEQGKSHSSLSNKVVFEFLLFMKTTKSNTNKLQAIIW